MTNHSVVKRRVRVREKKEMSKRGAADCDVSNREMTQRRTEGPDHRDRNESVSMKGLKTTGNKNVAE